MPAVSPIELLAAYDAQLRGRVPEQLPEGEVAERDGPLVRFYGGPGGQGWVLYRDLGGLEGAALDELIARQVAFFAGRGERFEWKHHGHDLPADLPERLRAHGLRARGHRDDRDRAGGRDRRRAGPARGRHAARGHGARRLRADRGDGDARSGATSTSWLPDMLESERPSTRTRSRSSSRRPARPSSAPPGSGSSRARSSRRSGAARRSRTGAARHLPGHRRVPREPRRSSAASVYLETDASDDSNPILQRLGFVPVTTTTPYIWKP